MSIDRVLLETCPEDCKTLTDQIEKCLRENLPARNLIMGHHDNIPHLLQNDPDDDEHAVEIILASVRVTGITIVEHNICFSAFQVYVRPPTANNTFYHNWTDIVCSQSYISIYGPAHICCPFCCNICKAIDHPTGLQYVTIPPYQGGTNWSSSASVTPTP